MVTNSVIYLNDVLPSVCSQGQFDSVYFDLSQAVDRVPHTLLLYKFNNFGLSSFCVNWFQSYSSNRSSFVRILGKFSSSFSVLSGVPQGSTLGPLTFLSILFLLKLIIPNFSYVPMIWIFAEILSLLKIIKLFKLTLMQYNSGVTKTAWNSTFRKLKLYLSH
jgi:hypothetical protein